MLRALRQQQAFGVFLQRILSLLKGHILVGGLMKRLMFVLGLIFSVLTLCGAGYVLFTGGEANAGFAVVPLVLALGCISYWRMGNRREK